MLPRVLLAAELQLAQSESKLEQMKLAYEQEIQKLQSDYIHLQAELSESEILRAKVQSQLDRLRLDRLR